MEKTDEANVRDAALEFIARRDHEKDPDGTYDWAGAWFPSIAEFTEDCKRIEIPTRHKPATLIVHCRGAEHVAALFGVDKCALLHAARQIDCERREERRKSIEAESKKASPDLGR